MPANLFEMDSLFEFAPDKPELPEGIAGVELSDVEAVVLKTLAFVNEPMSKSATKDLAKSILACVPLYYDIKAKSINDSINSLQDKGILLNTSIGYNVQPQIVGKILPLAQENQVLIRAAVSYFSNHYSYQYREKAGHLAILANDSDVLDEIFHLSKPYSWVNTNEKLRTSLLHLGNLALIKPFLSIFAESKRIDFLMDLPFSLHYEYFEQLKEIYLDKSIKLPHAVKYNYASCAQLILPLEEVLEINNALGLGDESLFFTKLLQGDVQAALDSGAVFLAYIQEQGKHKRKELPGVYGLLYAIVLMSSGNSKNMSDAATFLRSAIKVLPESNEYPNPFKGFAKIALLFANHKLGKSKTNANEIHFAFPKVFHLQFLTAVLSWFGKPMAGAQYPFFSTEKEEFEFRAAGLKQEDDSPTFSEKRLEQLRAQFNATPLAELYQPEEAWEDVLSILESALTTKTTEKKDVKNKRLIWAVDPLNPYSLRCLEQTANKNGWSVAKERSLSRLLNAIPAHATENDQAVFACLRKGYYGEIEPKNWHTLIQVLAKHPDVYTEFEPFLPLKIREEEAQIQINKSSKGATLKLVPESPEERIVMETPTSYIYIHWSAKALQIYNVLSDSNLKEITIPQKGMKKAKPVIDRLSEVMPVAGDFSESSASKQKSANIPVLQLTPVNNELHVQLLIEVIDGEEARFVPGIGSAEVMVKDTNGVNYTIVRNLKKEKNILLELADRIWWLQEMKNSSPQVFIDTEEDILEFLSEVKEHAPAVKVIWPKGERLRVAKVVTSADININVKRSEKWFDVKGEVQVADDKKLSIQKLLEQSKGGTVKYIQLDDKTYLSICNDLQKRLAALDAVAHQKGDKLLVHPLGSGNVENFIEGVEQVTTDKWWKEHQTKLQEIKNYQPSLAKNLQAELRPYQAEGVLWLDRLYNWGVGACLADDMGLGKTIQAISMLLKYAQNGPSLVLAPSSVCANWMKEIVRFAPTLNPLELKAQNREAHIEDLVAHDVLVVSYGIIQANPDLLATRVWNIVILDEAHAIKNAKSVRSKAVMKLEAQFKVITTGTPIQNHLSELWNLFQFINPGMLGTYDQFNRKFALGDGFDHSREARKALNKYIAPFILRRNKSDVLDDLPEKTEITLSISLSDQEREIYEVLRQEAVENIKGSDEAGQSKHLRILAEITKLRQMSCHPQLVIPESEVPSSKLTALESLVEDLLDANHKALVFSQFTKHLALIRAMLDRKGISYQYLDGSTPAKQREAAISDFQNGKSDLFLISLKAGGVGLNLTAADYVIHMDPWWNPAIEDQASDRAHRIGQQRPVTIYRLIAEDTIEEKIVKMHHDKRDLADQLLADTDQSAKISSEDLFGLILEK